MPDPGELRTWLQPDHGDAVLFAKRLSANDTGQTGAHQAGFFVPKVVAFAAAPSLLTGVNPRVTLELAIDSHHVASRPSLIYYNNATRDEARLTGFGGRRSPFQDPESTGALVVLIFRGDGYQGRAWIARDAAEEDLIEELIGPVLPGEIHWRHGGAFAQMRIFTRDEPLSCSPPMSELPESWAARFPSGEAISAEAIRRSGSESDPDRALMRRFRCEYSIFRIVEAHHLVPRLHDGFPTVESFLELAQSTLQRRKARAGRSLELQLAAIFSSHRIPFERGGRTELGNLPDFLFPSAAAYAASATGSSSIRMLAVKTTLRDRWRQILTEAARIPTKHLFTVAQGVSEPQFAQMDSEGVVLVVPAENIRSFPTSVQPRLRTLGEFIRETARLGATA